MTGARLRIGDSVYSPPTQLARVGGRRVEGSQTAWSERSGELARAMESHAADGQADLIPPLLVRLASIAEATLARLREEQAKLASQ